MPSAAPNPYIDATAVYATTPSRPGFLTTICVIAIVFGVIWVLTALSGFAGLLFSDFGTGFGVDDKVRVLQEEMQQKLREAIGWGYYVAWIMLFVQIGVAAAMIAGGVQALHQKEVGRQMLRGALITGAVFLGLWVILFIYNTAQTAPITAEYMVKVMKTQQPNAGAQAEMMANITRVTSLITMCVMGAWVVAEIVGFVIASRYLGQEEMQGYFVQD
jgi:hypothetical protein